MLEESDENEEDDDFHLYLSDDKKNEKIMLKKDIKMSNQPNFRRLY